MSSREDVQNMHARTKLACAENVFIYLQVQLQPPLTLRVVWCCRPFTSFGLRAPDYLETRLNAHCGCSEIINALSGVRKQVRPA